MCPTRQELFLVIRLEILPGVSSRSSPWTCLKDFSMSCLWRFRQKFLMGHSTGNFLLVFHQESRLRIHSAILSGNPDQMRPGILPELLSGASARNLFCRYRQLFSLRIPPRTLFGDSARNTGSALLKISSRVPFGSFPEDRSKDSFGCSLRRLLHKFLCGFFRKFF